MSIGETETMPAALPVGDVDSIIKFILFVEGVVDMSCCCCCC